MKEYDIKPQVTGDFKSKLEFIVSKYLSERLGLYTLYEPESFATLLGKYTPDFWTPHTDTYYEVKPTFEYCDWKLYHYFVKKFKKTLVIITPTEQAILVYDEYLDKDNKKIEDAKLVKGEEYMCMMKCPYCSKINFGVYDWEHKCGGCHSQIEKKFLRPLSMISFEEYYEITKDKKDFFRE